MEYTTEIGIRNALHKHKVWWTSSSQKTQIQTQPKTTPYLDCSLYWEAESLESKIFFNFIINWQLLNTT